MFEGSDEGFKEGVFEGSDEGFRDGFEVNLIKQGVIILL